VYKIKNSESFPIINTDILLLRKIKKKDVKDLFENFSSENVLKYYGMAPHKKYNETINLINNFNIDYENKKTIRWAIELKNEKKVIGTCGFHSWNLEYNRAEIGYELNENYWRKGYGTLVIKELLMYGFTELRLNRIEALVYPENFPSQILLEKLKLKKEGLLKEYCHFIGKPQDLIMYSILKRNWETKD